MLEPSHGGRGTQPRFVQLKYTPSDEYHRFQQTIVSLPLRKAKELGLETPTLETINALICALDWRFRNQVAPPAGPLAESK